MMIISVKKVGEISSGGGWLGGLHEENFSLMERLTFINDHFQRERIKNNAAGSTDDLRSVVGNSGDRALVIETVVIIGW